MDGIDTTAAGWRDALQKLLWPCSSSDYDQLGWPMTEQLFELPRLYTQTASGQDVMPESRDRQAAMVLALSLVWPWLMKGFGCLLEAQNQADNRYVATPLRLWVDSDAPTLNDDIIRKINRERQFSFKEKLNAWVSRQRLRHPGGDRQWRLGGSGPSSLVAAFNDRFDLDTRPVVIDEAMLALTLNLPHETVRRDVAEMQPALEKIADQIYLPRPALRKRAFAILQVFLSLGLNISWHHMRQVMSKLPPLGLQPGIYSGTPKHFGRVVGWWAQRNGIAVHRFAHGGDRASHVDPGWDLVELPFCSNYIVHGRAEARNIRARLASGQYGNALENSPKIETRGSAKHLALYQKAKLSKRATRRPQRLLYVAASHIDLVIPFSPSFKTSDLRYLEWQYWFVDALRKAGYEVTIRPHPRGVSEIELMAGMGELQNGTPFDPAETEFDCLVFDFPGSAWFDALATLTPMMMVDIGPRRLDSQSESLLRERCPVVPTYENERRLLRADMGLIRSGLDKAMAGPASADALVEDFFTGERNAA